MSWRSTELSSQNQASYLWPDKAAAAAFSAAGDEANIRAYESGNSWEAQPTAVLRRRMKMQFQQSKPFRELFAPYKATRADLFEEELRSFLTVVSIVEDWHGQKNTAFCKAVFASQEAATGLALDRKLSTKASPSFSKVVAQHWKVSIHIDGKNLNQPFGGSSEDLQTGEISYHGPRVDASMSIRPNKTLVGGS